MICSRHKFSGWFDCGRTDGVNSFSIASGSEAAYFIGCDGPGFYCGSRSIVSGSLVTGISATPLPATLPLFAGGLGFVGYLTGRKKRKAKQTLAVA